MSTSIKHFVNRGRFADDFYLARKYFSCPESFRKYPELKNSQVMKISRGGRNPLNTTDLFIMKCSYCTHFRRLRVRNIPFNCVPTRPLLSHGRSFLFWSCKFRRNLSNKNSTNHVTSDGRNT